MRKKGDKNYYKKIRKEDYDNLSEEEKDLFKKIDKLAGDKLK